MEDDQDLIKNWIDKIHKGLRLNCGEKLFKGHICGTNHTYLIFEESNKEENIHNASIQDSNDEIGTTLKALEHEEEEDHGKAYGLTMVEEDTTWELKEEPKIVLEVKDLLKGRGNVTTP